MAFFANGDVDYSSLNNGTSVSEPLPDGNYHVELNEMYLGESKSGKPMIKASFNVLSGDFVDRTVFANIILLNNGGSQDDSLFVHKCNEFLRGFGIEKEKVKLTTLNNYANLIGVIATTAKQNNLTYGINLKTRTSQSGSFQECKVISGPYKQTPPAPPAPEATPPQTANEEIPF